MKNINKIALIVSKILEVFHWVGAGVMTALLICSAACKDWLLGTLGKLVSYGGAELSTYGFEVAIADNAGVINMAATRLFLIGAVIILCFMAMIFRNVYLIIKKSDGSTVFNRDSVRMLKEIGIFFICIPVVGLIIATVIRLAAGIDAVEVSVRTDGFLIGIMFFCLMGAFDHGAALQEDVDGLL